MVHIITIGNADKGGFWYELDGCCFADGFATLGAAEQAAIRAAGRNPWEVYYRCADSEGRTLSIPGMRSDNHPEGR